MLHRKGLVRAAAFAALACAGIARAEQGVASASNDGSAISPLSLDVAPAPAPAPPASAPATPQTPLMAALHPTPVGKALENANITLSGYFEGAYTASFQHP